MKKVIIGLFVMMGLVACNEQQRKAVDSVLRTEQHAKEVLEKTAEAVNASCPSKTGDKYILMGVVYGNQKWTYCYTVLEDSIVKFDNPMANEAFAKGMKNATIETIIKTPSMMPMVNQLIEAKSDLMYEYTGMESGKTVTIIFTYPELRMIRDMSHNSQ